MKSMGEELYLLKQLAHDSRTRWSEKLIYTFNNGLADIEDLVNAGYLKLEPVVSNGEETKYYKIGIKGWDFLKQQKERKIQIGLTIAVLILTLVGLVVSFVK